MFGISFSVFFISSTFSPFILAISLLYVQKSGSFLPLCGFGRKSFGVNRGHRSLSSSDPGNVWNESLKSLPRLGVTYPNPSLNIQAHVQHHRKVSHGSQ